MLQQCCSVRFAVVRRTSPTVDPYQRQTSMLQHACWYCSNNGCQTKRTNERSAALRALRSSAVHDCTVQPAVHCAASRTPLLATSRHFSPLLAASRRFSPLLAASRRFSPPAVWRAIGAPRRHTPWRAWRAVGRARKAPQRRATTSSLHGGGSSRAAHGSSRAAHGSSRAAHGLSRAAWSAWSA
jgi:hypothetical protein